MTWKPQGDSDRRAKHRFAIQRELRFKVLHDDRVIAIGTGETIDISSRAVSFGFGGQLEPGSLVELSISWPVLLDESCPMRLHICGRVLRTKEQMAVCTVDRHEFRTQSRLAPGGSLTHVGSSLRRWAGNAEKIVGPGPGLLRM